MRRIKVVLIICLLSLVTLSFSQTTLPVTAKTYYLIHSSANVIGMNPDGRAVIQDSSVGGGQVLQFIPDGSGYYWIKAQGQKKYMALSGSWDTFFIADSTTSASRYAIEKLSNTIVTLRCKSNGKYLGTDLANTGSYVYSNKSGVDPKYCWCISERMIPFPVDTANYLINPAATYAKPFEGWGVSLCWWANMCGKWNDDKINAIVDLLVSPSGLNYNVFRYNIGGGDDPLSRHCTLHHMASGKGLRAEMEGFKDSLSAAYNWKRDAAQRKIMLKIKEKKPNAIFEAFSNSCPYYMTYSGCCAGNTSASSDNLNTAHYTNFANYLVDVCKFYKDSFNIEFKTLAPFNEPVTNYWAANGGQEGCHFGTSAQITFLKVLSPILKNSGLKTLVSASDETSAVQSVMDFKAYQADATALGLVGQWNSHTYTANNQSRASLRALSTANNKTLWMSEVGAGGTGIGGNLALAQKLFDDIHFMQPDAWVDWQYMEENNDQWCLINGSFSAQTYQPVKNYYVRKQITHYIHPGYKFLTIANDQTLAAMNPGGDSLVIVTLNNSAKSCHKIDLSMFDKVGATIEASRTSATENNVSTTDYLLNDSSLTVTLPAYSISTFVIPLTPKASPSNLLKTDTPYLIFSRTATLALQSSGSSLLINNYQYGDSTQLWKLTSSGGAYKIQNLAGLTLTDPGSYYVLSSTSAGISGQNFSIVNIGDNSYKISSISTGLAFDLQSATNTAGTKVGLTTYGTSSDAVTRQWIFVVPPVLKKKVVNGGVIGGIQPNTYDNDGVRIFGANKALVVLQAQASTLRISVFTLAGIKVIEQDVKSTCYRIPLKQGNYIVNYTVGADNLRRSTKVILE